MDNLIIKTKESREIVEQITAALKQGQPVKLSGFGVILVKEMPARQGRNPKTGEAIAIPASKKIKVRISSVLKEAIK